MLQLKLNFSVASCVRETRRHEYVIYCRLLQSDFKCVNEFYGSLVSRMWGYGLDRAGSGKGQVAGTCECGNEASGSMKSGEFLNQLKTG